MYISSELHLTKYFKWILQYKCTSWTHLHNCLQLLLMYSALLNCIKNPNGHLTPNQQRDLKTPNYLIISWKVRNFHKCQPLNLFDHPWSAFYQDGQTSQIQSNLFESWKSKKTYFSQKIWPPWPPSPPKKKWKKWSKLKKTFKSVQIMKK